ncbi:hypothetical protein CDD81_3862 [Ophiocordyceps australis]|uniref:Glutathione hydrolase n=1 Tax=Ophiocordyceps australis TaxID=1399860 RepID=A0A2C5YAS0_9HYPO|nr:hypothetical protein CDD81_3862 [Ophiocordyceps australis]
MARLTRLFLVVAAAGLCHASAQSPLMAVFGPHLDPASGAGASLGAVASEASECTHIGRDLLARGGNAVDALVGTTFCVGVVAMYHSGIGGGGFALVRDHDGTYEAVDFRETAPAAAHEEMYQGNVGGSLVGGLAVAVPGEVRGLEYIHNKYGVLPWKTVLQGAIHVARDGFQVSSDLVRSLQKSVGAVRHSFVVRDPSFAQDFAPNGILLGQGDVMTRKRYANTLEAIANQGADAFYHGPLAHAMIETIQASNGTMTLQDLANYSIISRPVRRIRFRDVDIFTVGAPASGAVSLSILKTLEQYSLDGSDTRDANLTLHRFTEAMRFGYAARTDLADPDFVHGVRAAEERLLDDDYARLVRSLISDDHTLPVDAYGPRREFTSSSHGTSHIVAADRSGMAVSLTSTINLVMGAQLMEPASGIILNNEMNDFSIPGVPNAFGFQPSPQNYIYPGKRPLSSITPVILARPHAGPLLAVLGAAGGSRILSATTFALVLLVDGALSMAQALRAPRLHDQLMPNTVLLERGFDGPAAAALAQRGHNVSWTVQNLSALQGIACLPDGSFEAVGEPRQSNSKGLTL